MQPIDDAVERAVRSFIAAMIGEVAHELNNRLATMRETVGLLEDLARLGKAGTAGSARAHASLDEQVGRSLNIVRALGGLGGAVGPTGRGFDAGAAITDLLAATERWAKRSFLAIEREIAPDLPRATGDAALFLCLVHRLILRCAERGQASARISLRVRPSGDAIRMSLVLKGDRDGRSPAADASEHEIDRELARRLGGELVLEGGGELTLTLAAQPKQRGG